MFANIPVAIPNPKNVALLAVLYLLLLRWIFRRLQYHRARQWRDVVAFLTVMLVCVSSAYLFFRANNKRALSYNAFLHLHGSASTRQAGVNHITGLYTTRETEYVLSFGSASYPIEHLQTTRSEGAFPQAYRVHQTAGEQEVRGRSGDWRAQFFQLSGALEFPLYAGAGLDERGLELLFRNDGEHTIRDCRLYFQQNVFTIGNLPPGEELRHRIPLTALRETEDFDPREFEQNDRERGNIGDLSTQENPAIHYVREAFQSVFTRKSAASSMLNMQNTLLPDALEAVHEYYRARPETLCLVGWLPESPIEMRIPQQTPGASLTLVTWEIHREPTLD